ncbi:hypothetical protein ASPVEDRAFT_50588 [Aspergillus versicolor CBS 583.65]|uniref:Rhodopsin domain-containing protein n=1 Tax=Aspergillus versicolor CBS 583.65 TaxID=1036611 RepID=A0A1L9PC28_ASPVE|nr:uncharacterized protein ASPVEDRAFT_50588 [Aspergillus versicolor CBS 583.65]OJI99032.1 hypothetical protein ASPVEDRAFT_50588 [Aspergillus versicolor CBS 583.65]
MQLPPPEVLLTWPTPNYQDPVTRGNAVLVTSIVFVILSTIVTALRVYTRLRITCTAGLDDIMILIGLGCGIAMAVVVCIATERWGWTRHIWDVPMGWIPMVSKLNLTFQILFSVSCSITKLSLLWFCRRLLIVGSKGVYSAYNIAMIVGMVIVFISSALFVLVSIFQCRPIHAYWDLDPQYEFTCLNDGAIVFSASVINMLTDVLATILPMPLIWKLKLPARQRLAVMSIFGLGIFVDVAGAIRTAYVWKSMVVSYDTTWEGWPVLLAATVEINLGLICASAPALRPLVNFCIPRLLGSSYQYGYNNQPRSKQSYKLRSYTGASKSRDSRLYGPHAKTPTEQLRVFRTVEMETHSEIRSSRQPIGNIYDISTSRQQSPISDDEVRFAHSGEPFKHSSISERSVSPPTTSIRSETRDGPPSRENESV